MAVLDLQDMLEPTQVAASKKNKKGGSGLSVTICKVHGKSGLSLLLCKI